MKVVFDPKPLPAAAPHRNGEEPPAKESGFVDLLSRALASAAPAFAPAVDAGPEVSFGAAAPLSPEAEVGDRAEEILEELEKYAGRLADPSAGLRELDGLLVDLHRRCQGLAPLLERLPEGSQPLRALAERVILTVQTEIFHLRRGDYLGT